MTKAPYRRKNRVPEGVGDMQQGWGCMVAGAGSEELTSSKTNMKKTWPGRVTRLPILKVQLQWRTSPKSSQTVLPTGDQMFKYLTLLRTFTLYHYRNILSHLKARETTIVRIQKAVWGCSHKVKVSLFFFKVNKCGRLKYSKYIKIHELHFKGYTENKETCDTEPKDVVSSTPLLNFVTENSFFNQLWRDKTYNKDA